MLLILDNVLREVPLFDHRDDFIKRETTPDYLDAEPWTLVFERGHPADST